MAGVPHIKKFLREETHYPNKKVVVVEQVYVVDNKFEYLETFYGKAEAELIKFIMFNLDKNKVNSKVRDELWDLIEDYGQEKYGDGQDDVHMQNAGADL